MRVLITGGSGQIGEALLACIHSFLPKVNKELNLYLLKHRSLINISYLDSSIRFNLIDEVKECFDIAIHLAAIVDTSFCQKLENHSMVLNVNAGLTKTVCEHADFVVLISTDNVFKGIERQELREDDVPDPCNFYGISKMEAENIVTASGGAVVRIQTMLGCINKITTAVIDTIRGEPHPPFWSDTYFRPSFLPDLTQTLKVLLEHRAEGTYHCSTTGDVFSRTDIAKKVLDFFREHNLPHQIDAISEEPCSVPLFPRYLVLNSEATRNKLGVEFSASAKALDLHLRKLLLTSGQTTREL